MYIDYWTFKANANDWYLGVVPDHIARIFYSGNRTRFLWKFRAYLLKNGSVPHPNAWWDAYDGDDYRGNVIGGGLIWKEKI
ncbi:hypothetical protein KJ969_03140 [Patescibacteria group bacterium]|nr:hypothetical protein [Patescibacteria group bacterium]MBU1921866.1 hypothetical protein [Patescibacteria group bacterium]